MTVHLYLVAGWDQRAEAEERADRGRRGEAGAAAAQQAIRRRIPVPLNNLKKKKLNKSLSCMRAIMLNNKVKL